MIESVTFASEGLRLSGALHLPNGFSASDRRAAFLVLHGFGSNKQSPGCIASAEYLASRGYVALRFDFRGCGESDGERGLLLCMDQVADCQAALDFLQARAGVDSARLGILGQSFGAAVAVYTGGIEQRAGAVVSIGGWGNGERKFRAQHATPEAWERFQSMLHRGLSQRPGGERMMVSRYDIVPIPQQLRHHLAPGSHLEFPWETVQSMYDFRADDVVGRIAPRPLLLLHSANDSVTPTRESIELFLRAGQPAELHLLVDIDHFVEVDKPSRLSTILGGWLDRHFPAELP